MEFKAQKLYREDIEKKSKFGSHCSKPHIKYERKWLGIRTISKVSKVLNDHSFHLIFDNSYLAKRAPNTSKPTRCLRVKRRGGVSSRLRKWARHPTWPLRRPIRQQWYEHPIGVSRSTLLHLQFWIENLYLWRHFGWLWVINYDFTLRTRELIVAIYDSPFVYEVRKSYYVIITFIWIIFDLTLSRTTWCDSRLNHSKSDVSLLSNVQYSCLYAA